GITLQGDYYRASIDQVPVAREVSGANLLGRWQQQLADGSRLRVQSYFDRADRDLPMQYRDTIDTWDIEITLHAQARAIRQLLLPASQQQLADGSRLRVQSYF